MAEEVLVGDPNPLGLGSEAENLSREVPVAEEYPPLPSEETLVKWLQSLDMGKEDLENEEIGLRLVQKRGQEAKDGRWAIVALTIDANARMMENSRNFWSNPDRVKQDPTRVDMTTKLPSSEDYPRPPSVKRRRSTSSESEMSPNEDHSHDTDEDVEFQNDQFSKTWDDHGEEGRRSTYSVPPPTTLEEETIDSE